MKRSVLCVATGLAAILLVPACNPFAVAGGHGEADRAIAAFHDQLNAGRSCHHLRGIHGGHVPVSGTAPSGLVWELGGKIWMGPERWARPIWWA